MIQKQWQHVVPGDVTTVQVPTRVRITRIEGSPDAGADGDGTPHMMRVAYDVLESMVTTFDVGRLVGAHVEEVPDVSES